MLSLELHQHILLEMIGNNVLGENNVNKIHTCGFGKQDDFYKKLQESHHHPHIVFFLLIPIDLSSI